MPKLRTAGKREGAEVDSWGFSTSADVATFERASKRFVRQITRSPEASRAYLVGIGVIQDAKEKP